MNDHFLQQTDEYSWTDSAREQRLRRLARNSGCAFKKVRVPFMEQGVHAHYYLVDANAGTIEALYPDLDTAEEDSRSWADMCSMLEATGSPRPR